MLTEKLAKQCGWIENGRFDAAVVGAGPAGVGAAIAAARKGLRVALIESCGFAGGVATKSCVPLYFGFGVDDKQSLSSWMGKSLLILLITRRPPSPPFSYKAPDWVDLFPRTDFAPKSPSVVTVFLL